MKASGKNISNSKKLEKDNVSEQTRDIASDLSRLGSFDEILEYLITYVTQTLEAERGSLFPTIQPHTNYIPALHLAIYPGKLE